MDILTAKENLFKMKPLTYLDALESKIELIRNSKKIDLNISCEDIEIINNGGKFYLKHSATTLDDFKITQGEKEL